MSKLIVDQEVEYIERGIIIVLMQFVLIMLVWGCVFIDY